MGRNAPCFCGSNKKTKKCHPNIDKDSLAAKVIESYNTIDKIILDHQNDTGKNSKCHVGCSECCYHYFTITDSEFYIILNEVQQWNDDAKEKLTNKVEQYMNIFEGEHPNIVAYLNKHDIANHNVFLEVNNLISETNFPCVFLEEQTQKCLVYNVRPLICRIHGNVTQITNNKQFDSETPDAIVCNKIGVHKDADWLVDVEFITGNEHDFKNIPIGLNKFVPTKQYPIFYHLYRNLFLGQLNFTTPSDSNLNFFSISKDEYARRIKYSLKIK